jgi:hypothetical protein
MEMEAPDRFDRKRLINKGGYMKQLYAGFLALAMLSMIFLPGCSKDDGGTAPPSFIEGYTVTLTEPSGTVHSGDYFPIETGYEWLYEGSANIETSSSSPYGSEDTTMIGPATGALRVLAPCNITLTNGTTLYGLYPIVDETNAPGQSMADTSRFFEKGTDSVCIKAIKLSDGRYLGVEHPLFIKRALVVGDKWETSPAMDLSQALTDELAAFGILSNLQLDPKAKFFVVGEESIFLQSETRKAVRLEQANDITLTGSIVIPIDTASSITCGISMTSQIAIIYHLIADTGIVHQNATGVINMTMTTPMGPATNNTKINECDLKLTDFSTGPSVIAKRTVNIKQSPSFNTQLEKKLWQVSQAIANVVMRKLTIQ